MLAQTIEGKQVNVKKVPEGQVEVYVDEDGQRYVAHRTNLALVPIPSDEDEAVKMEEEHVKLAGGQAAQRKLDRVQPPAQTPAAEADAEASSDNGESGEGADE